MVRGYGLVRALAGWLGTAKRWSRGELYRELLLFDIGNNMICAYAGRILGYENEEMTIIATPCIHCM